MMSAFLSAAYFLVHFRLGFIMEANTMSPKEQSDPGPYCLQYGLPKNISRPGSRWQVLTGKRRINLVNWIIESDFNHKRAFEFSADGI